MPVICQKVSNSKIEAKAGKDGSWQDVTGNGSISITGNQTVYVRVTDGEGRSMSRIALIKCYDTEKHTLCFPDRWCADDSGE